LVSVEQAIIPPDPSVDRLPIRPYFVYSKGGKQKTIDIIDEIFYFGRSSSPGPFTNKNGERFLSIKDRHVSRQHAKLVYKNNQCTLIDLGSSIEINGRRIETKVLDPGDRIKLGQSMIHYEEIGKIGGHIDTLKEGWLQKKSPSLTGKYQNRYWMLKPGRFYYLITPQDERVKGIVDLDEIEIKEEGDIRFSIITRDRKFHVKAASPQERDEWLIEINKTRQLIGEQHTPNYYSDEDTRKNETFKEQQEVVI